jgi:hypothetical protein
MRLIHCVGYPPFNCVFGRIDHAPNATDYNQGKTPRVVHENSVLLEYLPKKSCAA